MNRRALAVLAVLLCLGTTLLAANQESSNEQRLAAAGDSIVLAKDLPDVAECHGVLNQDIVNQVNAATVDPAATFEQWRTDQRVMMEAPPQVECASKLWQALKRKNGGLTNLATVPEGTATLGLHSTDVRAEQFYRALVASVGSNVDPAGGVQDYQGEVQVSVNPNNPNQLVAGANSFFRDPSAGCQSPTGGAGKTFGTQALYGSTDGGATWTYRCAPWPATLTGGLPGAQFFFGSDPAMTWDAQGRAYAAYMLISQTNSGNASTAIVVARSTDSGTTWSPLGTVVNDLASTANFDDKEFIAIDNTAGTHAGRIYVIWDSNNVERVARSDNGSTWTTVVLPTPSFGQFDIGGDVKVGADGTVYAIWNRLVYTGNTQTGEGTVFSKSTDGGVTWSTPQRLTTTALFSFGTNNKPPAQDSRGVNAFGSLGIDLNPASAFFGSLYVVYPDFPSGTTSGTNINIYMVTSSNGGTSWSTPVKVNDDLGTATQFFPWLSVDPTDGTVNVSWYDTRLDTVNNRKTQQFYARSSNGGVSFEPNILITDGGGGGVWTNSVNTSDENTAENAGRNANQYGDYSGIIAINRQVHPFWTDSRQFFPTADTQSPSRREDAATATIVNCSAPTAVTPSVANACSVTGVQVSWSATAWGTNATGGAYSVYRGTTSTFATATLLQAGVTALQFTDTTGVAGTTYFYFVLPKNNCPGTALTPMSASTAPVSPSIVFPSSPGTPATPTITPSGSTTFCQGSSVTLTSSSATGNQWYLNGSPISGATGNTYIAIASGNYTVVVTLGICSSAPSAAVPVTVVPTPATPTISTGGAPTTFCQGGSITLTSSTASAYQWYLNGGAIGGAVNSTYVATATGSYTVVVTENGCPSAPSAPVTVTVNPIPAKPTISTGGAPTTFCEGGSLTLTSSSATGNQWYLNGGAISGATNQTYAATVSGNYTVIVTASGCVSPTSDPVAVTVNPTPATPTIATGGAPTTFCQGGSITLTSSSATGNQWYVNGNPISGEINNTYTASTTGNYTVVVTENGCPSAPSAAVTVTVNPIPATPTITPSGATTFCQGGSVTLTSSSATGNQWYVNGNPISGATGNTFLAIATGSYTVVVTEGGCPSASSAAVPVTVFPTPATPTISTGGAPTTFCEGGSVTLTSSAASAYQWFLNGGAISGATTQTYAATQSGDYTVVVAESGCPSAPSAAVTVTVNPIPAAPTATNGGPYTAGDTIALFASTVSGAAYSWTGPNGFTSPAQNPTIANATTLDAGTYSVTVTVGGCTSPAGTTVVVVNAANQPPVIDPIGDKSVNEGATLTFTVTASDPDGDPLTYSASNLPAGATFDTTTHVFSWTPNYTQAGTYPNVTFTVTDNVNPPVSQAITITVIDTPPPCTSFSISPAVVNTAAAAGSQLVTVTASPVGCTGAWTAVSNTGFLSVLPTSGNGDGSVTVSWTANSGPNRSGTVTVAGNTFLLNQAQGAVGFGSSTTGDLVYTTLPQPCRIIDTRVAGGALAAGASRSFKVAGTTGFDTQGGSAGGCGVPSGAGGATAVMVNFVAVDPAGPGNLRGSAWPNAVPSAGSIVNYQALTPNLNIANGVVFPICDASTAACAANFDMTLLANVSGTQVVADVIGYFSRHVPAQSFLTYTTLPQPCRIIDTRIGGGALAAGVSHDFMVAGTTGFSAQGGNAAGCGIPDTAKVAVINFVAVDPQGAGNLKGSSFPNAIPATGSIINYQALTPALNVANGLLFPICDRSVSSCTADITLQPNVSGTQVVADVMGYFSEGWQAAGPTPSTQQNLVYTTFAQPCRIADTRLAGGPLAPGAPRDFRVAGAIGFEGQGGTAGGCGVPAGATAAMINFVAVNAQGAGNLKGSSFPNAIPTTGSIINYQSLTPALNIANGVLFPICDPAISTCSADMTLQANVSGADMVADVIGYAMRVQPVSVTLTPSNTAVTAGTGVLFTVSLDVPAVTATTITLSVDPSGAGSLPASVVIGPDQTSTTFTYTPSAAGVSTVTATFGSSSSGALVTATP